MIIQQEKETFESSLPSKVKGYTIKESSIAFKILSDGLYKNKILAVIRELSCNAHDAHVAAGKKTPWNLHLPTNLTPVFRVEDFGVGLSPENVEELYTTYFESTKRRSNKFIGALGLGSKSPFAYTNNFTVKTRWNGREHTFICFVDQDYQPSITQVGDVETSEPNGLTVEFAVKPDDFHAFYDNAARFFKYWDPKRRPNLTGKSIAFDNPRPAKWHGDRWYLESTSRVPIALMGNVAYEVNIKEANLQLSPVAKFLLNSGFVYKFKLGELNFAPSREDLSYDAVTNAALLKAAEEAERELRVKVNDMIKDAPTLQDFMKQLEELFRELSMITSRGDVVNAVEFFNNLRGTDKISYRGREYSIKELRADKWYLTAGQGHVDRCLRELDSHGFGMIRTLVGVDVSNHRFLSWIAPKRLTYKRKSHEVKCFEEHLSEWKRSKEQVQTKHVIRLAEKPIFVVVDIPQAHTKINAWNRHENKYRRKVYSYSTEEKVSSEVLERELRSMLESKFGSDHSFEIVKASELKEYRPQKEREPKPKFNTTQVFLTEGVELELRQLSIVLGCEAPAFKTVTINVNHRPAQVKFDQVSGYYAYRFGSSIYADEKGQKLISNNTLMALVKLQKLQLSDTILALTPKEIQKYIVERKANLKPLSELLNATIDEIDKKELAPFVNYQRFSRLQLNLAFEVLKEDDNRALVVNARAKKPKSRDKLELHYRPTLKRLFKYVRQSGQHALLKQQILDVLTARRELRASGAKHFWQYYLLNSLRVDLEKYSRINDEALLERYPLLRAQAMYGVEVKHLIDYVEMVDEKYLI